MVINLRDEIGFAPSYYLYFTVNILGNDSYDFFFQRYHVNRGDWWVS